MNNEFKKSKKGQDTVYTLESASGGGTSAGAVASVSSPVGGVRRRASLVTSEEQKTEPSKPRNFVAKNAKMGGAGAHKDKKKAQKQGQEKHKKPFAEALQDRLQALRSKLDEISDMGLNNYRRQAHYAIQGHKFGSKKDDPNAAAIIAKREKGMDQAGNKIIARKKAQDDARVAGLIAKLPELKAEYAAMKKEYESLGGNNWQYADREQNLTDYERKARSMEGPMNTLWRQISAAEKAQGVAEGSDYFEHLDNLLEDWQSVNNKDKTDGMSRKAVKAYRRENPGSKLKTAVTTKPSKLKKGGKAAKRRKSFCARMSGNKGPMKDKKGRPTPKAKALARWNCNEDAYMAELASKVAEKLNPQADVDVWVKDFQKADPNKYHQFKNKTPQKKAQMAAAAHYAANEPSKKK